jgi:CheY-like chemotaxis protein
MRVLVVDDNVDAADSLGVLLRLEQHQVDVVYDGRAALAKARLDPPGLVFMDISMPSMSGYELAQRLHEIPGCERAVLVALSGYRTLDENASKAGGIEFHLTKPTQVDKVLAIVQDVESRPPRS